MSNKKLITLRLDLDLLAWVDEYARNNRLERTAVICSLLQGLRDARIAFLPPNRPQDRRLRFPPPNPNPFPASTSWRAGLDLSWATELERVEIKERFDRFWKLDASSGCWLWNTKGRARPLFYWRGQKYNAPRFSLAFHKGPIPPGCFACHTCDDQKCVNPEHLWPGTARENAHDMMQKGRNRGGKNWKPPERRNVRAPPQPQEPETPPVEGSTLHAVGNLDWLIAAFPAERDRILKLKR